MMKRIAEVDPLEGEAEAAKMGRASATGLSGDYFGRRF